ncbi:hypothetical protein JNB_14563 [Janibacter sp. HTCC2649]|uniref:permease prefix domain 1-containing protein n=1 Tax=Janibacter sp. HTCC2649 TaxID=313589 RepID=UPI000067191F|nr:permease prefix domain 1-containing protein [Janibacter sp. HTCC2649]EAP98195.1 hypothetical protein JNB_14563 [Janibacter sp. HTCC2649]
MTTKTTLTDRYVWTVTRHLPDDVGPDVAQELRGTIADAVDGKVDAGADPAAAEQEAIAELGDPDALARHYGGRPNYLIGPGLYPDYLRLMRLLPPIVLPIVLVANLIGRLTASDDNWGSILLDSWVVVLTVGVHLGFWVTLTFALIEWHRPETDRDRPLSDWKPDQLSTEVPWRAVGLTETAFSAGFAFVLAAVVAWQFTGVSGDAIQVLNPHLALVWEIALVALLALDGVLALMVWQSGRWTPVLAALNVATNAASATLLVWLLSRGELLTDLPTVLGERFGWSTDWAIPTALVAAGIVLVSLWECVESVVKARRSMKGQRVA